MSNKKIFTEDDKLKIITKQSPTKKKARRTSKALNKSFIEKQKLAAQNEPTLNEAAMRIKKVELERTSTPNLVNICEHCNHLHAQVRRK